MFLILLFPILGFLTGLSYIMLKRKIRPGKLLAVTFLALLATGIGKVFKDYYKKNKRKGGERWGF